MVTRPALFLALPYLAHRVNRLVTEVEAWRYEQTVKAKPTGAVAEPGFVTVSSPAGVTKWSGWTAVSEQTAWGSGTR